MIKRIELYRLLKELERLYICVRFDPEEKGLTREIIPYNYRISLKIIRQGSLIRYFRLGMGICPPFCHENSDDKISTVRSFICRPWSMPTPPWPPV